MIEESKYWQKDLLNTAENIEKRYRQKKWTIRSYHALEKEVFLSLFIVRKLIESNKIPAKLMSRNVEFVKYPRKSIIPVTLEPNRFNVHYDLSNGKKCSMSIKDFASQFIHSYIFSPFVPFGSYVVGIYFCSDRDKKYSLFYVKLQKIVETLLSIGKGKQIKTKIHKDTITGDISIIEC